jgi:hypothetical protein
LLNTLTGTRALTDADLAAIATHLSGVGFSPAPTERAGGRLAGLLWQGRVLRGSDRLTPADAHYLRHVVVQREWPIGTTLAQFLASLATVVRDPTSGMVGSRFRGQWHVGVIRHSRALQGPRGYPYVFVDYRVSFGYWMTALQPVTGLAYLHDRARSDLQWWRPLS